MSLLHPPPPGDLGPTPAGPLRPCPPRANCVCSDDPDPERRVNPLPYGSMTDAEARDRLRRILANLDRTSVTRDDLDAAGYLAAEVRTRVFGFVDDLEFRFDDAARVVHLRSGSRVGRNDLGVNQARAQEIAARWNDPA